MPSRPAAWPWRPPKNPKGAQRSHTRRCMLAFAPIRHVCLPQAGFEENLCLGDGRYKNGDRGQTYNFSRVFGDDTGQEQFFQASAQPMVRQLMRTQTSSVMIAYGTSAAGKTYTIEARPPFPNP